MTKTANFKGYVTRNLVYIDHVKKIREKKDDHWERIYEDYLLTLEKTRGDGEEEPKQQDINFREYYMNQVNLNEEYLKKKEKNPDGKYVQPPMMKKSLKVSCHQRFVNPLPISNQPPAQVAAYKDWLYEKVSRDDDGHGRVIGEMAAAGEAGEPLQPAAPPPPAEGAVGAPSLVPAAPCTSVQQNQQGPPPVTPGKQYANPFFAEPTGESDGLLFSLLESKDFNFESEESIFSGSNKRPRTDHTGNIPCRDVDTTSMKPSYSPDKPPAPPPSDLSTLFGDLQFGDNNRLHVVLVASPRKLDRRRNGKIYYNRFYPLHSAEAETHGIKTKASRTKYHRVCVLDSGDHHISPNSFFNTLKQQVFHSLTVIAHGISDPGGGEDGMIAFVDSENGAFYPCRMKHFADELYKSDTRDGSKDGTLELLFLNGCCTNILGHAIANKWVAEGKRPPVIIAWKENVLDLHAFKVSQIFFEEHFKSRAGDIEGACQRVEAYCRADGTRVAYEGGGQRIDVSPQEPEFILPGQPDMSVSLSNAIVVKKVCDIKRILEKSLKEEVVQVRKRIEHYEHLLAHHHPQFSFLYRLGYLDRKRGKREGTNLGGLKPYRFAGREWLFKNIREWIEREGGEQTLVLLATAGFGKSAFAAQLVEYEMKSEIIAFHFCSNERTSNLDPTKFVEGLVVSLAKNVDGFTAKLLGFVGFDVNGDLGGEPLFQKESLASFRKFVKDENKTPQDVLLEYVLPALKEVKTPEDGRAKLIVIDSMDEASLGKDDKTIAGLVAEMAKSALPNWVKILVTSRGVTEKLKRAKSCSFVDLDRKDNEDYINDDIKSYLEDRLEEIITPPVRVKLNDVVGAIMEKCMFMFLYAVNVVDDIEKKRLSLNQPIEDFKEHLPKGLNEYYEKRFQEMFGSTLHDIQGYASVVSPILEVIAAAMEPLPTYVILQATGPHNAIVCDVLERVAVFCRSEGKGINKTFTFVHRSFKDWILNEHEESDNLKFMVEEKKGHDAIIKACDEVSEYQRKEKGRDNEEDWKKTYYAKHMGAHMVSKYGGFGISMPKEATGANYVKALMSHAGVRATVPEVTEETVVEQKDADEQKNDGEENETVNNDGINHNSVSHNESVDHEGVEKGDDIEEIEIWEHVSCDICDASPIRGGRHKCEQCLNYDVCDECLDKVKRGDATHIDEHEFEKVKFEEVLHNPKGKNMSPEQMLQILDILGLGKPRNTMFVYASCEMIEFTEDLPYSSLRQLPKELGDTISQYYSSKCKELFGDIEDYTKNVRPILEVIVAAREPVPLDVLKRASNLADAAFDGGLEKISAFSKVQGEEKGKVFELNHQTLNEWILKDSSFGISVMKGHKLLALAYATGIKEDRDWETRYFHKHGVFHVAKAKEIWEDFVGMGDKVVDAANHHGKTTLSVAAKSGSLELVSLLLRHADVDKSDIYGVTPLYYASKKGHHEVVATLLEGGANANTMTYFGMTPLFSACLKRDWRVVQCLVNSADPDEITLDDGRTPLAIACEMGDLDIIKVLVAEGKADLEKANDNGSTPIHIATLHGHLPVVKYLVERGADWEKEDKMGMPPMNIAALGMVKNPMNDQAGVHEFIFSLITEKINSMMASGLVIKYDSSDDEGDEGGTIVPSPPEETVEILG